MLLSRAKQDEKELISYDVSGSIELDDDKIVGSRHQHPLLIEKKQKEDLI